jgi:hypothetical protein
VTDPVAAAAVVPAAGASPMGGFDHVTRAAHRALPEVAR